MRCEIRHYRDSSVSALASRDIPRAKEIEQAPQRELELYRMMIRTLPDIVWLKSPDGIFLACNHRFEALLGVSEQWILGKTDADVINVELASVLVVLLSEG